MPTTYTDLMADVRKRTKQVSLEELKRRLDAGEKMTLVDVREKDEWRARLHPGRRLHPPRLSRDPGRAEAPRQERAHRRLLRGRHALGARRGDARRARVHERRDGEPRLRALEGPRLARWSRRRSSPTRSASATRVTSSCPRWARSGRPSCSRARCCSSAPAAWALPPRCTWPRPGVGTLGDRRRRRGRRLEPPAADHPRDQPRRHAQGRERGEVHRRAEPRREGRAATRSA